MSKCLKAGQPMGSASLCDRVTDLLSQHVGIFTDSAGLPVFSHKSERGSCVIFDSQQEAEGIRRTG